MIAEVKRRSPSKGWIAKDLDPAVLARDYERGGASAISVLTDEASFAGSRSDFEAVRNSTTLPLLRKDFTVCFNDIFDAAEMGASAVLLIVAALSDSELQAFYTASTDCGMDCLVEVHDENEARRAVQCGARIVGINQRDLRTFKVDPERALAVRSSLPSEIVTVAESGLQSVADVELMRDAGFDAVLVGETFVRAVDTATEVRQFSSVRRHRAP